ncbi:MAG TPA: cupin domain-containing protein [Solirubrobacterales bacterium]|nr:cupin domain-containing protein [Solirubrobacterales bacterium]
MAEESSLEHDPVPEASVKEGPAGLTVGDSEGWFVMNLSEAATAGYSDEQYHVTLEGHHGAFPHFGVNVRVLAPGKPASVYHREPSQEGFLVLAGECTLIVEDQERNLRRWDYFHCPPETGHVLIGAGDAPCVVLMIGARAGDATFPHNERAAAYGASAPKDTDEGAVAYRGWPEISLARFPFPLE